MGKRHFAMQLAILLCIIISLSSCNNSFNAYPYYIDGNAKIFYALSDANKEKYDIQISDYFENNSGFYASPLQYSKEETDILFTFNKDLRSLPAYKVAYENQDTYSLYSKCLYNYPSKLSLGILDPWEFTVLFKVYDKEKNLLSTEEVEFILPFGEKSGYVFTQLNSKLLGVIPIAVSYTTEYITLLEDKDN